jgi:hypothetical protein
MAPDPLEPLRQHPQPSPELERRVVSAVREAGGIRRRPSAGRFAAWAAAAVVIFSLGVVTGRAWPEGAGRTATPPTRWMLLLGGDVSPSPDGASRAGEYGAWLRDLQTRGIGVSGAELDSGGRVLAGAGGAEPMRPLAETGGYFIIEATTEAEAVKLAETCPHRKYGGSIVVRRLVGS